MSSATGRDPLKRPERPSVQPALETFLFAPADARAAGLFRLGLGGIVAIVFAPTALPPLALIAESGPLADVYRHVFQTKPYWWLVTALALVLAAGVRPRATGFTLAALVAPLVLVPGRLEGRLVLGFALLAFSFLRSDARFSVARLLRPSPARAAGPIWPVRLIQLELSLLYGVNAVAKSSPEFLSGDVLLGQSMMLPNFLVDLTSGSLIVGPLALPVRLAAAAAVLTEYALALGFWVRRLRLPTAMLGVLFHVILSQFVRIGYLDWVSLFLYGAFLLPFDRGGTGGARARAGRELPREGKTPALKGA